MSTENNAVKSLTEEELKISAAVKGTIERAAGSSDGSAGKGIDTLALELKGMTREQGMLVEAARNIFAVGFQDAVGNDHIDVLKANPGLDQVSTRGQFLSDDVTVTTKRSSLQVKPGTTESTTVLGAVRTGYTINGGGHLKLGRESLRARAAAELAG